MKKRQLHPALPESMFNALRCLMCKLLLEIRGHLPENEMKIIPNYAKEVRHRETIYIYLFDLFIEGKPLC